MHKFEFCLCGIITKKQKEITYLALQKDKIRELFN